MTFFRSQLAVPLAIVPYHGTPGSPHAWLTQRLPDISNNVGPVKLFLSTLFFSLERVFLFRAFRFLFFSASTTKARS